LRQARPGLRKLLLERVKPARIGLGFSGQQRLRSRSAAS
jgi:hypothetical protein